MQAARMLHTTKKLMDRMDAAHALNGGR